MKKTGPSAVYEQRVPFHDCDPLNIVWHGNYYKYLEIARETLMRQQRLDVPDLIELGYAMVVIESRCRYAFPLRFGERFTVRARLVDWHQRLQFAYEIRNLDHSDRRVARAWTTLVAMREGEMLLETPDEIVRRIEAG
ncbi:MAG: acyl-CoA thioesterase [Myxococcota bacterium]